MPHFECLNLTQQVTHALGRSIISGVLQSDAGFITEAMLCNEFDVSRTSIREAVKMLTSKGLVSSHPKQGIRIETTQHWNLYDKNVLSWILDSNPSLDLIYELMQLRLSIEPHAASLAAIHIDESTVLRLQDILTEIEQRIDAPLAAIEPLKIDFHTTVLLASDNRFFAQLKQVIQVGIQMLQLTPYTTTLTSDLLTTKRRLLQALIDGDSQRARSAMNHLIDSEILLLQNAETANH